MSARCLFGGSMVALVTPFHDGAIDYVSWQRFVDWQIDSGTQGIVVCGTTGEASTLTFDEHCSVMSRMVEMVRHRVPVVAGTGSNSTAEAISLSQSAERVGIDGILCVTPYYNKPTPRGLYEHFKAIRQSVSLPIILYNVPSRTGISFDVDTISRIHELGGIDSIKEASGNLGFCQEILARGICILSGEDGLTFPLMALGASGVISVVANFAPVLMRELCDGCLCNDIVRARTIHRTIHVLAKAAFAVTNPIPAKAAVSLLGFCQDEYRLPLTPLERNQKDMLLSVMQQCGLV